MIGGVLYTQGEQAQLPAEALAASLGCGNPTAVADLHPGETVLDPSGHARSRVGVWLGEVVATAGLLFVIAALTRTGRGRFGPLLVPAWIGGAYFFTSSTSFANPAITLARAWSDTFAGIAPGSVPAFVVAQVVGAALGAGLAIVLFPYAASVPLDLPEPIHEHRS